jgi:hypothetical protein
MKDKADTPTDKSLTEFLKGKPDHTIGLLHHFIEAYKRVGDISIHPAKTMIGIATSRKRIAYVTQLGKNFIHIVFPFEEAHSENLCFQKIAQVPGDAKQFNHHFRMYAKEDVNKEVLGFMKLAYSLGK